MGRSHGLKLTSASRPGAAQLPALYQPWVEALLGGAVPAESEATCEQCAMLAPAATAPTAKQRRVVAEGDLFFDPRVKCCTYIPALPNFLVGRILLDPTPEMAAGKASVEARIVAGVGVTPAGLDQPPAFGLIYRNAARAFGHSVTMRCPHYLPDTGACGIWRHRQSVCSTWFCKYERGAVGQRFWSSLRHLLGAIERALMAHCVVELNPGRQAIELLVTQPDGDPPLSAADLDGVPDAARQRSAWGRYAGREREFYEAAARLVEPLAWSDVARLGGAQVALTAALLAETYQELRSDTVPARLRAEAATVEPVGPEHVRLSTYNAFDPLVIPRPLVEALHFFDGRPTPEALEAIAQHTDLDVGRAVVRRLVDFEVLVDAGRGPNGEG